MLLSCSDKYESLYDLDTPPTIRLSANTINVNAGNVSGGKLLLVCSDRENNQMNFRVVDTSHGKVSVFFDKKEIYNEAVPIIGDTTKVYIVPKQLGSYLLKFVVNDRFGKQDSANLLVKSGANQPPNAMLQVKNITGREYLLDASGSNDPDGTIQSFHYQINGSVITTSSSTLKHIFYNAGTYEIKLYVEDYGGNKSSEITQTITVL
jgi:PKD repeat protein